jgi:calcium-dependent protein kinase
MGDLAESEVDKIMEMADTDNSGSIEFSEWVVVSINLSKVLTEEKFKAAFDIFDRDKTGKIDNDELKMILGVGKNVK